MNADHSKAQTFLDCDISMVGYWLAGDRLVTRDMATAVATILVRNKYGQPELDQQLPFFMVPRCFMWVGGGLLVLIWAF